MSPEKLVPSKEVIQQAADAIAAFQAQLVRAGLKEEVALELAARMGAAASSWSDGGCGDIARRLAEQVLPQIKKR